MKTFLLAITSMLLLIISVLIIPSYVGCLDKIQPSILPSEILIVLSALFMAASLISTRKTSQNGK